MAISRDHRSPLKTPGPLLESSGPTVYDGGGGEEHMARLRDESKKERILEKAKELFAAHGYLGTSITDIVEAAGFPVGTIYTYFSSKEDILSTIIENGWESVYGRLQTVLEGNGTVEEKFHSVLYDFFPEILKDATFITILFTEAAAVTGMNEKLSRLTTLMGALIRDAAQSGNGPYANRALTETDVKAAVTMFFLGILDASRLAALKIIDLSPEDLLSGVRKISELSLGIRLPPREEHS